MSPEEYSGRDRARRSADSFPAPGLRPPRAPESLRSTTLDAARSAFRSAPGAEQLGAPPIEEPSRLERWIERLIGSPSGRLAWAAALLLLLIANLAPPPAATDASDLLTASAAMGSAESAGPFGRLPLQEARRQLEQQGLL